MQGNIHTDRQTHRKSLPASPPHWRLLLKRSATLRFHGDHVALHLSEPTTFSSHLQHLSHPPTVSVLPGSWNLLPTQHTHRRQGQWRSHPQETPCPSPDMPSASSPSRQRPEHLSVFEGAKDREIMPELTLTPTEGQRVCTTISKVMSTFNTKRPMPTDISLSLQELSMIRKPD